MTFAFIAHMAFGSMPEAGVWPYARRQNAEVPWQNLIIAYI